MISRKVLIVFLFLCFKINAQEIKLANVTIAELEEKKHPTDTSAVAAILYKKEGLFKYNLKDGFVLNHEYIFRIKVYKKEGLSWVNFEVPYYVGYEDLQDESVKFSNACTYNLEDGKIVKTKLNNEGSFKKNLNSYWSIASISLPNAKVGSVIEFKYTITSEHIVKFPVYENQYSIPLNYSEYNTEVPDFFIYKTLQIGPIKIEADSKFTSGSQSFDNKYGKANIINYKQITSTYVTKNIPAIKDEDYVDNIKNYTSAIQNELERIRYPNQPVKDYTLSWEGVAKSIFKSKNFGDELNERTYLLQDLKEILKNAASDLEKLDIIFKFVQHKMNWNNQNGYYTDKGVIKAYIDRTGNVAEINFILTAMLKFAGINANPVLISTIDHGVPVFPSRTGFNYVVSAAEIEGKRVLLDATDKFTTLNILPLNALNRRGRLIREDGTSEEISLVPETPSKDMYILMVSIDSLGNVAGKFKGQKVDYEGYRFRVENKGLKIDSYLEKLENDLGGIQIKDYIIENKDTNLSKPVTETFSFISDKHCEIIGNKMFINPLLFFTQTKNPFLQEKRQMPIYFGYPTENKYNIIMEVPEGYAVESIPKPIKIATGENAGLFIFNVLVQGNKIQIQVTKELNKAIVSAEFYNVLKTFYQQMIDKQNEKIILKKI
jgi:hypothetical protein